MFGICGESSRFIIVDVDGVSLTDYNSYNLNKGDMLK
jgi:3-deoxy-D-manno-octulosonate 8-phosphate phosphatase KdsC-like HAD superfamily phosphatase